MGQADKAQQAFARGADYQTSFYGLLSAQEVGLPTQPSVDGQDLETHCRQAAVVKSSVYEAGLLLLKVDRSRSAVRFFTPLAASQRPQWLSPMSLMAEPLGHASP